ncbi:MAG: YegS/Rv2252/BmrU family lipid kinase, partial [Candidatus Thermoplasmatota archaeon]|nr:YegS/Rv2252/BmrU family lipid kinase [Candidatus Thermoplasmatota archaeon]
RVLCIFNPEAGRGRFKIGPKDLEKMFREAAEKENIDLELEMLSTNMSGDAEDLAREHFDDDVDVIAACGGDGTVYEAINGMAGSGKAMGIVPLGSGNDTIVSITGSSRTREDCVKDIIRGKKNPIDIGRLNDRYFMNVVGIGMDAAINHEVANRRNMVKRFGPTVQYMFCTFKVIPRWKDMDMVISENGKEPYRKKVKMLTIGNGTTCGGGFKLTPKAKMDDGKLDLSLIKGAGVLKTMVNVPKAFKGDHLKVKGMTEYRQVTSIRATTVDNRELPFHIDGEKGFAKTFDLEIVQEKMWTVHPLQ